MASAEALRASRLFSRLDGETLERIAPAFTEADFPANHVLIEPRTTGAGLFVICDGSVVVEVHGTPRRLGPGGRQPRRTAFSVARRRHTDGAAARLPPPPRAEGRGARARRGRPGGQGA